MSHTPQAEESRRAALPALPAYLAQVADGLPDGLLMLDRDWHIRYANPASRRMSRILPEHIDGPTLWQLFPETLGSPFETGCRASMLDRTPRLLESYHYEPFDIWVQIHLLPVDDGLTLFYRDVTDTRAADVALRASEERYRVLTELSPQSLWTADAQGRVLYANQRFLTYLGRDFVPQDGTEYLRLFADGDRERVLRVWSQCIATGEDYDIEARLIRAEDRAERWWHLRASPVRDSEGRIQQWLGLATDIHESRIAAERLREQYAEVDRQRQEAEVIYRVSPIGMALYDARDLRVLRINDHQAEIFGVSAEEARTSNYYVLTAGVTSGHPLMARALAGERVLDHMLEGVLAARTGEYRYWNVNYSPVFAKDGSVRAVATATAEVTQQKRAEAALIQAEKLAAVGRMAASIAHEINNPLESVTNLLFIARSQATVPEVRQLLDLADQELRRVSIIANQTLRFHKQASAPREIAAAQLFDTVLNLYEGRLRNSDITVARRDRALKPIACFEGDIRQAINNLVSNAIDSMPTGGHLIARSRECHNWRTGHRGVMLTVADTGCGMDTQTQQRIFDAFFTTKGMAGTGLGLWITAGIVERHHGTVRLRSRRGVGTHGTVFTMFLPFDSRPTPQPIVATPAAGTAS